MEQPVVIVSSANLTAEQKKRIPTSIQTVEVLGTVDDEDFRRMCFYKSQFWRIFESVLGDRHETYVPNDPDRIAQFLCESAWLISTSQEGFAHGNFIWGLAELAPLASLTMLQEAQHSCQMKFGACENGLFRSYLQIAHTRIQEQATLIRNAIRSEKQSTQTTAFPSSPMAESMAIFVEQPLDLSDTEDDVVPISTPPSVSAEEDTSPLSEEAAWMAVAGLTPRSHSGDV